MGVVLVVDVANVMGSRPDGWWRDRKAAAARLLPAFGQIIGTDAEAPDGRGLRISRVVAVLKGAARGAVAPGAVTVTNLDPIHSAAVPGSTQPAATVGSEGPSDQRAVEVVEAEHDGDSTIVAVAEKLVGAMQSATSASTELVIAVLVVTADRGLRRRLPAGSTVAGPKWLNRLIGR